MHVTTVLILLAATALATPPACAEDPSPTLAGLTPGLRLRVVTSADIETTGSLVDVEGGVMTLATDGPPVRIRVGDVRKMQQSRGRKGNAVKGGLIGAGVGGVLFAALPRSFWEEGCTGGCQIPSRGEAAMAGAFASGLWGLLIGHLVKRDDWRPVDVGTWSVAVVPAPQGAGARLALRW